MPQTAIVDLGYRGVDKGNQNLDIKHRGKFKSMTEQERKLLKRRQAIEPIIGHLKADHRMNRCHLKGSEGDSLHACGVVRCGLQHSVVAENDRKERRWAFFAPAKCLWFRELEAQITSNSCHELKHATLFKWRCDLKMNFSGTTKKLINDWIMCYETNSFGRWFWYTS